YSMQAQATRAHAEVERAAAWPHSAVLPLDGLVQCVNAVLLGAVLWNYHALPRATALAACHVLLGWSVYVLGRRDDSSVRPIGFVHDWLPAVFILGMYFELGLLIPLLRDYNDLRFDRALQSVDVWLLGDPVALVERYGSAWLSDVLTLCYLAYYPLALLMPAMLYVHGDKREFQQAATIILVGFVVSYIGYVAWPALGPHRVFDTQRPVVLDGLYVSHVAYQWLLAVPHEPPDAFPSGHALISALVPALAWPKHRGLFYVCAPICAGIVLATLYLRLHYVADVVVALLLAPVCYRFGKVMS
ncbi:MAG TPA: phosphatase PAP2 family protein, partial [Polyangiales bacterium]|nr:phosphatase PAP2 family protein [Polyangiales bacterium]